MISLSVTIITFKVLIGSASVPYNVMPAPAGLVAAVNYKNKQYDTAIIALDDPQQNSAKMLVTLGRALRDYYEKQGDRVLDDRDAYLALLGTANPKASFDIAKLKKLLADAEQREAYFDDKAAETLRQQVLDAFNSTMHPDVELREIAVAAARDLAIGSYSQGKKEKAALRAREVWRRFGHAPIDQRRHSPDIQRIFDEQQRLLKQQERVLLSITSNLPGTLYADGLVLGRTDGLLAVSLPVGDYRVWLDYGSGWSLPHPVQLKDQRVELTINTEFDKRISVNDILTVQCDETCFNDLTVIAQLLNVANVIAVQQANDKQVQALSYFVKPTPTLHKVDYALKNNTVERIIDDKIIATSVKAASLDNAALKLIPVPNYRETLVPRFSPLYLIPFGGGQFAQDRNVVGGIYLTLQTGLIAWYAVERYNFNQANKHNELIRGESIRKRANLALGALTAAMVANVIEAIIVGQIYHHEAPE
ncbi:MAG: hypothetical protein JW841_16050 [Deltaproteobacteria bacterium]|nr:hypothetical protein [Deltaproteobacteria bacterium]